MYVLGTSVQLRPVLSSVSVVDFTLIQKLLNQKNIVQKKKLAGTDVLCAFAPFIPLLRAPMYGKHAFLETLQFFKK